MECDLMPKDGRVQDKRILFKKAKTEAQSVEYSTEFRSFLEFHNFMTTLNYNFEMWKMFPVQSFRIKWDDLCDAVMNLLANALHITT